MSTMAYAQKAKNIEVKKQREQRKMKFRVAQKHLQRQEAKVSKVQLYKAEAGRRLTQLNRWFDNLKIYLIPWEAKIKRIESTTRRGGHKITNEFRSLRLCCFFLFYIPSLDARRQYYHVLYYVTICYHSRGKFPYN